MGEPQQVVSLGVASVSVGGQVNNLRWALSGGCCVEDYFLYTTDNEMLEPSGSVLL